MRDSEIDSLSADGAQEPWPAAPSPAAEPLPHCTCQAVEGMYPHKDFCWLVKAGLAKEGEKERNTYGKALIRGDGYKRSDTDE